MNGMVLLIEIIESKLSVSRVDSARIRVRVRVRVRLPKMSMEACASTFTSKIDFTMIRPFVCALM